MNGSRVKSTSYSPEETEKKHKRIELNSERAKQNLSVKPDSMKLKWEIIEHQKTKKKKIIQISKIQLKDRLKET